MDIPSSPDFVMSPLGGVKGTPLDPLPRRAPGSEFDIGSRNTGFYGRAYWR